VNEELERVERERRADEALAIIDRIRSYAVAERKFTREEMNARR
jgi:hypothetical protein